MLLFGVGNAMTVVSFWEYGPVGLAQTFVEPPTHVIKDCLLCGGYATIEDLEGFLDSTKMQHVQYVTWLSTKYTILWIKEDHVPKSNS